MVHNKMTGVFLCIITLAAVLAGCGYGKNDHHVLMGFDTSEYTVVEEEDSHGGFHGDGSYYLILDCSANPEKALSIVSEWSPMPLSENLNLIMYGGEKDGVTYVFKLAEEAHWPMIEHGYYKFYDEQAGDPADDAGVFERHSFNFKIAAYDTDRNIFYYFRFDT